MLTDAQMRLIARLALAAGGLALSGCYYVHLAAGQLEMNRRREPIAELVATAMTRTRRCAKGSTTRAARGTSRSPNWDCRTMAATAVMQTWAGLRDLEPVRGARSSRSSRSTGVSRSPVASPTAGTSRKQGAARAARHLASRGQDVYIGPSLAYSTLGHLRDPVLNTMLRYGDAELAALIFHELAHQAGLRAG